MGKSGSTEAGESHSFTVDELREAKHLLDHRKGVLINALRGAGYVAARLHDNFYRDPVTHYPIQGDPDAPRAEIQFIASLFVDQEKMKEGARVVIMRRYLDSMAYVYRLESRPYARLSDNWVARFEKPLRLELRNT